MIKINNLLYYYQQQTMKFDVKISAGERIAILGPSGAGKSTLLNLIAGFISPQKGNIILNNRDCTHESPAKRPISMLFQENNLFAHLSVKDNIGLGLNTSLKLTQEQIQQLHTIAQHMGLENLLNRLPNQLSGGQRQRTALARCLVRRHPILLLDEPFSALDPALRNDMLNQIKQACDEHNLTLLMVTHNHDDAKKIAERTLVINMGEISYDGNTQELINGNVKASAIIGI